MKCRVKLKKRTPSQSEPQIKPERKKEIEICGVFSGGKINIKGHSMSLTYVDMAGGKCCVQSSPMDCRLQLQAVIVSDQPVHLSEAEDPGCWDSWGKITALGAEMQLWIVAKSPSGPCTITRVL